MSWKLFLPLYALNIVLSITIGISLMGMSWLVLGLFFVLNMASGWLFYKFPFNRNAGIFAGILCMLVSATGIDNLYGMWAACMFVYAGMINLIIFWLLDEEQLAAWAMKQFELWIKVFDITSKGFKLFRK